MRQAVDTKREQLRQRTPSASLAQDLVPIDDDVSQRLRLRTRERRGGKRHHVGRPSVLHVLGVESAHVGIIDDMDDQLFEPLHRDAESVSGSSNPAGDLSAPTSGHSRSERRGDLNLRMHGADNLSGKVALGRLESIRRLRRIRGSRLTRKDGTCATRSSAPTGWTTAGLLALLYGLRPRRCA